MLSCFIDEVPAVCFEFVEQISTLLLSLTAYEANVSIRQTSAQCLAGLMKSAKDKVEVAQVHAMARTFMGNLSKTMEVEYDTDALLE